MNQSKTRSPILLPFLLSITVALILMILPLSQWLFYFWPDWVVLTIFCWALIAPDRIGPLVALVVGTLLEVLFVRKFGVISVGLIIVTFIVNRFYLPLRILSIWQQALLVGLLVILFKLITGWLYGMVSGFAITQQYWYSVISDILIWPFIATILHEISGRRRA